MPRRIIPPGGDPAGHSWRSATVSLWCSNRTGPDNGSQPWRKKRII